MPSKVVSLAEYRERLSKEETRVAWLDFPSVFIFCPLGSAKKHERYDDAKKSGNNGAALQLVKDIVPQEKIEELRAIVQGSDALILPVHAIEEFGTNKIPAALAYYLAVNLQLELCGDIVQANKPQRTDKGAYYRLSQYPFFDGNVQQGRNYVILDDTLSMGGTLASLRGYIENKGGRVILAVALTGHDGAASLNIKEAMLKAIRNKHGDELDEWWKSEVGFGVDKLTQGEAGHLKKASSIDEIRSRILAHRPEE
ncbi:adenine phosphoribosyltransferase [Nitrincola nitratireducens]|uniref:Adenine phosphoribosyltransferase n=1 Tax=Nitrincola nitratireducens TaxID=1229521 RepID=W9VN57_9GAMM|nr:adenine phosphoribosyltransferase [Nitrincola nitratireducens]